MLKLKGVFGEIEKQRAKLSSLIMASLSSFPSKFNSSFPSNPNSKINLSYRNLSINFSLNSEPKIPNSSSSSSNSMTEKKSLAVATGELFLGLASRIIKSRSGMVSTQEFPITMFREIKTTNSSSNSNSSSFNWESFIFKWRTRNADANTTTTTTTTKTIVDEDLVVWEQGFKDMEAERALKKITSPGFSFSAAGLLFPYHLGVAQYLIEKGYIKETTPLAGSSAGAIVCAVIASGSTMEDALKATKILADDCRLRGTAFRLGAVLRDLLVKFLPDDVHTRSNGRVRVAVTQILWRPRGLLVDQFDSKEDLINALITSSFIPGYLAPTPATFFRNRVCIDGGLTLFMPPTSASKTVRVCAFPTERLGLQGIGISPDCNPENQASPQELFNWALEPAEDHVLDKLFELGYMDAAVWGEQNPVEELVADESSPGSST